MLWILGYILVACIVFGLGVTFDEDAPQSGFFWPFSALIWPVFCTVFVVVTIALYFKQGRR